jgi:hypothetical protein
MTYKPETPFDSIDGSHEYVALLAQTIEEVRLDVEDQIARAVEEKKVHRKEALQLVSHNLTQLSKHMTSSRRILNDQRFLRRVVLQDFPLDLSRLPSFSRICR